MSKSSEPLSALLRFRPGGILTLLLVVGAAAGCRQLAELKELTTKGYMARDLLPADREVGSWRRLRADTTLGGRDFQRSWGPRAARRLRHWELSESVSCRYRLGATGRSLLVEIYDLGSPRAAFDLYAHLRFRTLSLGGDGGMPPARVTKVGAQGLLYAPGPAAPAAGARGGGAAGIERVLACWAERFLVKLTATGGSPGSAEAALVAFGTAIGRKTKQPFELAETYALQVPGEVPNSERYVPKRVLDRPELPSGVIADWQGKSGRGTLFVSVFPNTRGAGRAFEQLRRAAGGVLTPGYERGLFAGRLPGGEPLTCFLRGTAIIGLCGRSEVKERMAVLESIRKRCTWRRGTPAIRPGEGRGK
jgi:hypothetical protein